MTLTLVAVVVATVGPGAWSLDEALDIRDELSGVTGLLIAVLAGGGGAAALLARLLASAEQVDAQLNVQLGLGTGASERAPASERPATAPA